MKKFNWQMASVEEIAEEIKDSTPNRVSCQVDHYKKHGNEVMLERIERAVKIVKLAKLREQVVQIEIDLASV